MGLEQKLDQYPEHIKKGDIVYVLFPFSAHQQIESLENDTDDIQPTATENTQQSDTENCQNEQQNTEKSKDRPAVVLFRSDTNNFVFCAITTKGHRDPSIEITNRDLQSGHIGYGPSFAKPNIIATIHRGLVRKKVGKLGTKKLQEITDKVIDLLNEPPEEEPVSKAFQRPKTRVR